MIEFIQANWADVVLIATSIVTIASVIVRYTPTPKDDAVLDKIIKIVKAISIPPKS